MARSGNCVYTYTITRSDSSLMIEASGDPLRRLLMLQSSSDKSLHLVAMIIGDIKLKLRKAFAHREGSDGWFNIGPAEVIKHPVWLSGIEIPQGSTRYMTEEYRLVRSILESVWKSRADRIFYISKDVKQDRGLLDEPLLPSVRDACRELFPGCDVRKMKRLLPRIFRYYLDFTIQMENEDDPTTIRLIRAGPIAAMVNLTAW